MANYRAEEYYDYQPVKEELYNRAIQGERFRDILSMILDENNLRMSYRQIKANKGSKTRGTDEYTIDDVKCTSLQEYLYWMRLWFSDYHPKTVRRKYVPKPNGDKRPLGIPCMRDKLLQQSVLQILEPIAEANMCQHSFGFRKGRSVQDAIEYARNLVRVGNYFAVDFDIRKCFDTIPHNPLMDMLWKNGICDKRVLMIVKKMLKASVKEEDGSISKPDKGTPQGGIVSPLLMNIYLNELDKWVSTQYEVNPSLGKKDHSHWFRRFRKTRLKKGILTRYADDFVIFTDNEKDAKAWYYATQEWLKNNLQLEINEEKSRIVDLRKQPLTFLGYKIAGNKLGVAANEKDAKALNHKQFQYTSSSLGDKLINKMIATIRLLLKLIRKESYPKRQIQLLHKLNSTILGYHNFAQYATQCSTNCWNIYQRLKPAWYKTKYLKADATTVFTDTFQILYPECKGLSPIFSIKNVTIFPIWKVEYRKHTFQTKDYLRRDERPLDSAVVSEIHKILQHPVPNSTVEYNDLRISKYSAQRGCDYVTGVFLFAHEVHCHHIIPRFMGGKDKFNNLTIVSEETHKLIHNVSPKIPKFYTRKMLAKLNKLRDNAGNSRVLFIVK